MKRPVWILSLSIAVFFLLVPAAVNADERFDKGSWELAISSNAIGLDLEPSIGYFLADNIEGIIHFDFTHRNDDLPSGFADSDMDAFFISIGVRGHLPMHEVVVPFFGGGLTYFRQEQDVAGTTVGDIDQDGFAINGEFGIRILIGERASINPSVTLFLAEIDNNLSGVSLNRTGVNFGFSFSLFL